MPIKICPRCNQRFIVGFDTTDVIHECNSGNAALDQEDVVVTGNWEEFGGSGTKPAQAVLMQGAENKVFGTNADIEFHEDIGDFTRRGLRASTRRQRQHFEFIEVCK